jgi:membrane protease subunit HflK
VRVDQVRQFELGTGDEFINGDGNIVTLRAVVHYRVADPVAFLIHAGQSDLALRNLARHSLIAAISRTPIDAILSGGRQTLCDEVRSGIARRSQSLNLGFEVLAVSFDSAGPPAEVVPDFAAAAAARSQKEQRLVEAAAEAARLQRNATAQAEILLGAAVTEAARTRASANGEAARFAALASESAQRRDLAKMRLYLETVTALVAKVRRKVVVPSDRAVDLNLIGP